MSVLIVDDNEISAKILAVNLQREKHPTVVAQNGLEALEYLESVPDVQLVITDIMMPEMDGMELIRKIKELPELKDIPVIICTAVANVETIKKASLLGCKHYLIKPIQPPVLLAKVMEVMKEVEPVLAPKNEIIQQFGLDSEVYEEIIIAFTKLLHGQINQIEESLNDPAYRPPALEWPKLSEDAAILGAGRLKRVLERLQTYGEIKAKGEIPCAELRVLWREMKLLLAALPASTATDQAVTEAGPEVPECSKGGSA